ncbi:lipase family protein [Spongisporangium articulatum]|uniref:Lipase family protein n=1 Tax=Spongisporangium articulatum TaxID=3362603 RepID=A0ABW8AKM6_9ACTN
MRLHTQWLRLVMGAAVVTATVGVAVQAPAHAAAAPKRGGPVPAFYVPPTRLPATNGAVIRTEQVKLALSGPVVPRVFPRYATRLMYRSTDANGTPVAVTGAYFEPTKPWPGAGPRPLVVVASGTVGQGDQCAPSRALSSPFILTPGPSFSGGLELPAIYRLLAQGMAVVETDYIGLGTPDRVHTYVQRIDEGHAVLDAARAARALPGVSITRDSKVGAYGYSQGGGASASAAELQPTYAPDVPLTATYAGAPPADLAAVTAATEGTEIFAVIGYAVNGFVSENPRLQPVLDRYTNDAGKAALKDVATTCIADTFARYAGGHTSTWTKDGRTLNEIAKTEPLLREVFAQQVIGTMRPAGNVRVATGVNDNLVTHAQVRTMAESWCRLGGNVTYVPVKGPRTPSGTVNHFAPLILDQAPAVTWISSQLRGSSAPASNCAAIPTTR